MYALKQQQTWKKKRNQRQWARCVVFLLLLHVHFQEREIYSFHFDLHSRNKQDNIFIFSVCLWFFLLSAPLSPVLVLNNLVLIRDRQSFIWIVEPPITCAFVHPLSLSLSLNILLVRYLKWIFCRFHEGYVWFAWLPHEIKWCVGWLCTCSGRTYLINLTILKRRKKIEQLL